MLALKSYGINTNNNVKQSLSLPRIDGRLEKAGAFSLKNERFSNERRKAHPLYHTESRETGKFVDFKDLGYKLPSPKKNGKSINRNNDFTDTYICGTYTDTSLGSVLKRKAIEKEACAARQERREKMQAERDRAQNEIKMKQLSRMESRERRRAARQRQTTAVTLIQSHVRRHIAVSIAKNRKDMVQDIAARRLQLAIRRFYQVVLARKERNLRKSNRDNHAATIIKSHVGRYASRRKARKELSKRKAERDAERRRYAAQVAENERKSATKLQALYRGNQGRLVASIKKQEKIRKRRAKNRKNRARRFHR